MLVLRAEPTSVGVPAHHVVEAHLAAAHQGQRQGRGHEDQAEAPPVAAGEAIGEVDHEEGRGHDDGQEQSGEAREDAQDQGDAAEQLDERHGPREDRSINALKRTFRRLRFFCSSIECLDLTSDKKHAYGRVLRQFFGGQVEHTRISSKRKRDLTNPLWPINLANTMARDLNGRLRRESWLCSKHRRFLRLQLHIFAAYRNFVRLRTNRDTKTPAQALGFVRRRVDFEDLLTLRQDWRDRSIHPLTWHNHTVRECR